MRKVTHLRFAHLLLAFMVVSYFLFFSFLTVRRHQAFQSTAFDLGIYNQTMWNTVHGDFLRSTNEAGFDMLLADHFQPTLLLFVLLYLIHTGPATLLVGQTAILALGALPAYGLALHTLYPDSAYLLKKTGRNPMSEARPSRNPQYRGSSGSLSPDAHREWVGLTFAAAYLLTPALEQANLFDFHPMTLAASFLLFTFYFLRAGRHRLFLLFLALAIGCKEVLPLVGILLGVYVLVGERKRRLGLATMALSSLWLYVGIFVIIPHFNVRGASQYFALHYGQWGNTPYQMVRNLVTHPVALWAALHESPKPAYLWALLSPWAMLPLAGLPVLLLGLPVLAVNLLSATQLMHDPDLFLHYAAPLVPILFVAGLDGIRRLSEQAENRGRSRRHVVEALALIVLFATLVTHRLGGETPLAADFRWPQAGTHQQAARAIFAEIPPAAVLSASDRLNPHVSGRRTLYLFPRLENADTILYDATPTNVPVISRDAYDFVQSLIHEQGFGVVDGQDGVLLLRRGEPAHAIPEAFYTFALAGDARPQFPTSIQFGDSFWLTGFDVVQVRPSAPRLYLRIYAQLRRPPGESLRVFTFLTGEEGRPIPGSEYEIPAAIWYPTSKWTAGVTVRLETLHWELYQHARFGVALIVTRGDNPWDVGRRLRARVVSPANGAVARQNGTLLELVRVRRVGRHATVRFAGGQPTGDASR